MSKQDTIQVKKLMERMRLVLASQRDLTEADVRLAEARRVHKRKLDVHESRKAYKKANNCFELYRGRFYRQLKDKVAPECKVTMEEIKAYWKTMWVRSTEEPSQEALNKYIIEYYPGEDASVTFSTKIEFINIIKYLSWRKAAGVDGVYNYFIKHTTAVHDRLYAIIRRMCIKGEQQDNWFYKGRTYLIPKKYAY